MILINIGSKYINSELTFLQNKILGTEIMKKITLFSVIFIATRNVKCSFILTLLYFIIVNNAFNSKSKLCVLPKHLKKLDLNNDNKISEEELKKYKNSK